MRHWLVNEVEEPPEAEEEEEADTGARGSGHADSCPVVLTPNVAFLTEPLDLRERTFDKYTDTSGNNAFTSTTLVKNANKVNLVARVDVPENPTSTRTVLTEEAKYREELEKSTKTTAGQTFYGSSRAVLKSRHKTPVSYYSCSRSRSLHQDWVTKLVDIEGNITLVRNPADDDQQVEAGQD